MNSCCPYSIVLLMQVPPITRGWFERDFPAAGVSMVKRSTQAMLPAVQLADGPRGRPIMEDDNDEGVYQEEEKDGKEISLLDRWSVCAESPYRPALHLPET